MIMLFLRKRGSVVVDAAVCLPIFLLAMGLLLCLMMETGAEEQTFDGLCADASRDMEIRGAVYRLSRGNLSVSGVREKKARVSVELPSIAGRKGTKALEYLVYRPFIGAEPSEGGDDIRVYVFPKRGQRYHIRSCIILQEGAVEAILSKKIRAEYAACRICNPQELKNGSRVYMFSEGSTVYHRKSCASISKAFVSMPLSQAKSEGYTPCMFCFGSGDE